MKSFKNLESTLAAVEEMPGIARKKNMNANQNDPKQATQYKRSVRIESLVKIWCKITDLTAQRDSDTGLVNFFETMASRNCES